VEVRKGGRNVECKQWKDTIHGYLDQELNQEETNELLQHTEHCQECHAELHELKQTIMLLKDASPVTAPADFTTKIMNQLPHESIWVKLNRWVKGHPALVAASIFLLLMTGSFASIWSEGEDQFYVSVPNTEQIVIDKEKGLVIVPEGEVIQGDITVRNGSVDIRGEVNGDVIVIDGEIYQASTAQIIGQTEEIDQFLNWAWYQIKKGTKRLFNYYRG
jgi:anti-sigma factor RsiW